MKKLQIALSLAAFILYSGAVYKAGGKNEKTLCKASMAVMVSDAATARATLVEDYRKKEKVLIDKIALIDATHLKDKNENNEKADRTIADLRSGVVRLRKQYTSAACGVSSVSGVATGSSGDNASTEGGLSPEAVESLVYWARDADDIAITLKACQAILAK